MALSPELLKILDQRYDASTLVEQRFKGLDMAFKTDSEGNPILLFLGKRDQNGSVKGQRYVRTLKFDAHGHRTKDHWELKGKAS